MNKSTISSYHHRKTSNKLTNSVPPRLMSDTVRDIFNTFSFFDLNANQFIEINELKRILHALNFKKTTDECDEIINIYDLNNDQMIDFHEFIFALARLIKHDVFTLLDIQQRFKYLNLCLCHHILLFSVVNMMMIKMEN